MKDFHHILAASLKTDWTQRKGAVATVVKVHGSSYRSPGARMLIMDDGRWIGSISGGCLEGDALRKARQVMNDQQSLLVTYDTREESNQNLGIGLGCNGVIDVFIQPIDQMNAVMEKIVTHQKPSALATVVSGSAAGHLIWMDAHHQIVLSTAEPSTIHEVSTDLRNVFHTRHSHLTEYNAGQVFLELIQPVPHLILFGGGFDARPVSQLAKSLGWRVEVTDECVAHIAPLFFPTADKLSLCQREFIDRDFSITPYTACVLMSHNYEYDRDVLKKIIHLQAPYIGILGPRKRFDKMLDEFAREGIALTTEQVHSIHSPIGLDIGAETPDEIALSIIAEIQSKFSNRSGGFLKYHPGPIHQRQPGTDQVLKQVYLDNSGLQKSV
jgi:xanthine dehydrogenase accessory factor